MSEVPLFGPVAMIFALCTVMVCLVLGLCAQVGIWALRTVEKARL